MDTSFLITFADPTRPNHSTAHQYYEEALRLGATLYLSTIAISEFHGKQSVNDLPLRNFIVVPFNVDHAMTTGELNNVLRGLAVAAAPGDPRDAVKDDVKLIAQAVCESITHVITEDACTLSKYLDRLRVAGELDVRSILLKDGYQRSQFNNDGQTDIED
jgi:predicted nucleic acid-binding protein